MEETTQKKNQSSSQLSPKAENNNGLAKYSGLAFELLGIIVVGVGSGYGLDSYLDNSIPILTIIFSLLSIVGLIYYLLQRLPKD